jgi:hypothetical protein
MLNHSYDFFSFYHAGVWIDGIPYQRRDHLNTCLVSFQLLIKITLWWPLFLGVMRWLTCHGLVPLPHKERWCMNMNLLCLPLWTLLPFAENLCFF